MKQQREKQQKFDKKFTEYGALLSKKKLSLKMKGRIYQSCAKVGEICGSETWYLRKNEMAILRRNEKAMCGFKLIEKRSNRNLFVS